MSQTSSEPTIPKSPALEIQAEEEPLACSNCGVSLSGKFCHQCGQSSRSMIKFFGEVIRELLDDVLGYDSRLKHSIVPLLFNPGKLTLEYIKGRRFFYVMPFRLYLITSLLFIFALQFVVDPKDMVISGNNKSEIIADVKKGLKDSDLSPEEQLIIIEKMESTVISETVDKEPISKKISDIKTDTTNPKTTLNKNPQTEKNYGVIVNAEGAHFRGYPVKEEGLFKNVVDEINSKGEGWLKNPKPLIDELFNILPYMMFFLLPIFALFQKLFYAFSKHFYIEHLIFSLHNHCFLYSVILLDMAVEFTAAKLLSYEHWMAQATHAALQFLSFIIGLWIVIYIVLAVKKVYQQGWLMTLSKSFGLFLIYLILSASGLLITIVVGAYRA